MNKTKQVKEVVKLVRYHFPSTFYTADNQKDLAIAYLMGMGWGFDEATDVVFDRTSVS